MKEVNVSELVNAVPLVMTRKEKLLRWAKLVMACERSLGLYHNLEYMSYADRDRVSIRATDISALGVAVADPEFQAQGLSNPSTLNQVMDFFTLSQHELHEFSCDCGGSISNENQARRIEALAGR